MFFRKTLAVCASVVLGLTLAQVDAGARGGGHGGGMHGGMTPGFGHGFSGNHFLGHGSADSHGHFDEHGREHESDRDHGRDHGRGHDGHDRRSGFAMDGFGRWRGASLSGHFGNWQPGHWAAASGFGGDGRFSAGLQGVWGR
jgi:hypothetical protein